MKYDVSFNKTPVLKIMELKYQLIEHVSLTSH